MQNETLTLKAAGLAILLAILWGGNSVSIKIALAGFPPMALACARFILGSLVVWIWAEFTRVPWRLNHEEKRGIYLLVPLFIIQIYLLNAGTQFTLAARSTIFIASHPFFIALFAHYCIPGDRLDVRKASGMALAFCGVAFCFYESMAAGETRYALGDIMILFSSVLLGARQVYVKHLTQYIHPVRVVFWQGIISIPFFLVFSLCFENWRAIQISPGIIAALLYQGIVVAGICFILLTCLLRRYMASRLGVFAFANPLFGVLLCYLLLSEKLSMALVVGGLLVGIGISIVNSR